MQQITEAIRKYLLAVVCPLIKQPDKAQLRVVVNEEEQLLRFRLVLESGDIARIIGRNGMTASAIRSLAKSAGERAGVKVIVHILSRDELEQES